MTMSMNQLKEQAEKDCTIDTNKLDRYSLNLAKTISRWNSRLLDEKMVWEKCNMKYHMAKRIKHEH